MSSLHDNVGKEDSDQKFLLCTRRKESQEVLQTAKTETDKR